jgi:hypothetical protein
MNDKVGVSNSPVTSNQRISSYINPAIKPVSYPESNTFLETLALEGWDNLLSYLKWIGLDKDPKLVVLSSAHHYYYDIEDMKNVKTVVNLKGLNQIKKVEGFLHSIFNVLQQRSNFIGYFLDNERTNYYEAENYSSLLNIKVTSDTIDNGLISRIPFFNRLNSIMDSKTNNHLSKMYVSRLLEKSGFKIMDITELNGLTYFHSRKVVSGVN